MLLHFGLENLAAEWSSSVVCIGTFDGVHLGHQQVIRAAQAEAELRGAPCVLVTFDRHPAATLAPERKPPAIQELSSNLQQFDQLGVDAVVVLPFDRALAATSADDFLNSILVGRLKAEMVVIGHDFAFGHNREGDHAWLQTRIATISVPPQLLRGTRISSSQIRQAIQDGQIETANELLGRPFTLTGIVAKGQQLGRTIGYPTANLQVSSQVVIPSDGVYAGACATRHGRFKAAVGIGMRPTVGGTTRTVEAFLLDFPGHSLYGHVIELGFLQRLRDEHHFESLEELKEQMSKDVEITATISA